MDKRGKKVFKLLDRYLGIPILFILGLFKQKCALSKNISTIGILTVPAIGDIILINGLLRDIKDFNNEIKIILFVTKEVREIAEIMNSCDELIEIEIFRPLKAIKTLRRHPVDIFIDSSQWARLNAILTFFSKSQYKIGFKTKNQHKHFIFDFAAEHSDKVHELYNYKKLIFTPAITIKNFPEIKFSEKSNIKDDRVVIHIAPSGYLSKLKRWKDNNWREIIDYLLAHNLEIYFTGSASDRMYIDSLLNYYHDNEKIFNVAGKYTLRETVSLLLSAKIVISVNTGTMHLASTLDCNLIALHGPTNPKRWGPLNNNSIVIQSDYPQAPCLNLGFEYNCTDRTGECMKRISTESVISAIKKFMNQNYTNSRV
jgi:lipopolysaccharide heptosyltransferase III